jgi:hypothetical protein
MLSLIFDESMPKPSARPQRMRVGFMRARFIELG